jgi:predicted alpha/beta superfamily hydrolase
MPMLKFLLHLACWGLITHQALASTSESTPQPGVALVGGKANHSLYLRSHYHSQDYLVQIYQPQSPAPASGYPVLYLLDGNATFPYASVMAQAWDQAASRSHRSPPLIVAIGYPNDVVFDLLARSFDYTPAPQQHLKSNSYAAERSDAHGGAEWFYQFIQFQLKPIIAQHYQIDPQKQTLFGHSYGGLFTLYVFLAHPDAFQGYMAASPAIWWQDFAILKQLHTTAPPLQQATALWLSVGELEKKQRQQSSIQLQQPTAIAQFADDLPPQAQLELKTVVFADLSHLEALFAAINLAFKLSTTRP